MSFTVYKSSAGSGKTFTLVKEYLKIALQDTQQYKKILAITFTNKAAAEMKERVIKALKEISAVDTSSVLAEILEAETDIKRDVLRVKAKKVLENILHNYSDFAIGTIDSFVHRIVRAFAFDLKLPINFEIETDENVLLNQAIELLLNKLGSDEQLTRLLVEFTESKADEEKNWHIENDLAEFAKNLLKYENYAYIEKVKQLSVEQFVEIKKQLEKEMRFFEASLRKTAEEGYICIKESHLPAHAFYQGERGIFGYLQKLVSGDYEKQPNSYVLATIDEDKWTSGKADKEQKITIEKIKNKIIDCYNRIQELEIAGKKKYSLYSLIYKNIYPLAVLNEIEKVLEDYKKQNNILHISEFNNIISKIVLTQPVPFIYERLGEKYNHYLIDEFQDTSILQWQNLLPLIDNSLATGKFNMIVGDSKQAIYRWRGGEVEQFVRLPEVIYESHNLLVKEREAALKRNFVSKKLADNYRSKCEIVEFNNVFFNTISQHLPASVKNIYEGLEQNSNPKNTGGYIRLQFVSGNKQEAEEQNKQEVIEVVNKLISEGYLYSEIAVICRTNVLAGSIASFLTDNNIPVVSQESLLLKASVKVNFITSVLAYIKDEHNQIAQAGIITFLCSNNKLSSKMPEHFLGQLKNEGFSFAKLMKDEGIDFDRNKLSYMMLYELCEEIVRIFSLNETYSADVQFFLEEVLKYVGAHNNSTSDFLEWWDNESLQPSVVVPEDTNAVKILSIHKSKGLEYRAVILPFADWGIRNSVDNIWVNLDDELKHLMPAAILPVHTKLNATDYAGRYEEEESKSLLDNVNLLYVALTRAAERMYVYTGEYSSKTKEKLSSITDFFNLYVREHGIAADTNVFEWGAVVDNKTTRKKSRGDVYEIEEILSEPWEKRISIRKSTWTNIFRETNSATERGTLYHEALSKINSPEDVERVISLMQVEGLINPVEKQEMIMKLNNLISKEELKIIYDPAYEVHLESEIILPSGETYRPDRVLSKENHTIIVDFKTGRKKEEHKEQLKNYEMVLSQMGYKNIDMYLLYIDTEEVLKITG